MTSCADAAAYNLSLTQRVCSGAEVEDGQLELDRRGFHAIQLVGGCERRFCCLSIYFIKKSLRVGGLRVPHR